MRDALSGTCLAAAFLYSAAALSADQPGYRDGVLTIPRVDTPEKVGQYQDVAFQSTVDGTWRLTSGQILQDRNIHPLPTSAIQTVEIIKTPSSPVSVYMRVSGSWWACGLDGPERIHQRLENMRFDVGISIAYSDAMINHEIACVAMMSSFRMTVPLEVYGLSAGTYTYNVNGITGSFTLDSDNRFSDDCDVAAAGSCTSNTGNL